VATFALDEYVHAAPPAASNPRSPPRTGEASTWNSCARIIASARAKKADNEAEGRWLAP
jgi:hypothetical protein